MKKIVLWNFAFSVVILLCSCTLTQEQSPLDMKKYLSLADGEKIYPTEGQLEMLLPLLPEVILF